MLSQARALRTVGHPCWPHLFDIVGPGTSGGPLWLVTRRTGIDDLVRGVGVRLIGGVVLCRLVAPLRRPHGDVSAIMFLSVARDRFVEHQFYRNPGRFDEHHSTTTDKPTGGTADRGDRNPTSPTVIATSNPMLSLPIGPVNRSMPASPPMSCSATGTSRNADATPTSWRRPSPAGRLAPPEG